MTAFSCRSLALFTISAVIGSLVPFAAAQALFTYERGTITTKEGVVIQLHKSYTARDRADYKRAQEIYEQYLQQGYADLVVPNINDRETIDPYLKNPTGQDRDKSDEIGTPLSTKDYVPSANESLGTRALNDAERAALNRSFKTGRCWTYKGFSKEFDVLCRKLILGRKAVHVTGFETDLKYTRAGARLQRGEIKQPKALYEGLPNNRTGGRNIKTRVLEYYKN